ncbi:toxin VasX [Capnocytophaga sputigena]|uniref:toxin VasX n=1 Tax=Capnocytophaga sputigena TaxID=1019 RepID=UPI00288942C5|nr:toxin VasX [Capnocytophaga sputigena]
MDKKIFFTVEYPGAETKKSPDLCVREKGIYLHFLRTGLFLKNTDDSKPQYEVETIYNNNYFKTKENGIIEIDGMDMYGGLPEFEHFDLVHTALNEGYLYLINDDPKSKNAFIEVEVDSLGRLRYIIRKGKKHKKYDNSRNSSPQEEYIQYLVVQPNTKYWIAFSYYQWSHKYLKEMLNDIEKRKKRMRLIDCKAIKIDDDNSAGNPKSYKKVKAAFRPSDEKKRYHFKYDFDIVICDENNQSSNGDNDFYEDLFIILDDPIGCAFDMGIELSNAHTFHYALIESLQTGDKPAKIFDRLCGKYNDVYQPSVYIPAYETEQFQALFGSALSLYHFLYGDPPKQKTPIKDDEKEAREEQQKYMDDLREETSREKIEKVLGVEERKQQRQKIKNIREDFINYLWCDYFCKFLEKFMGNSYEIYLGKYYLSDLVNAIAVHPHYKDRFIDLPKDYEGDNDPKGDDFFERITQENNIYHKIFMAEVPEKDLVKHETLLQTFLKVDVEITFMRTLESIAEGFAMHCFKKGDMTPIFNYIASLPLAKEHTERLRRSNPNNFEKTTPKITEGRIPAKNIGEIEKNYIHISRYMREVETKPNLPPAPIAGKPIPDRKINILAEQASKKENLINRILNHPRFRAFIFSVELLYTSINFNRVCKDPNAKNSAYAGGAFVQSIYSFLKYAEAKKLTLGFSKEKTKYLPLITKGAEVASQGITIGMCAWESFVAFYERDTDAAWAWVASGTFSTLALLGGTLGLFESVPYVAAFFASPWGIALVLALSLGAAILAFYLTDDALERFVKNNLLSEKPTFKRKYYQMSYTEELIERRRELVTRVEEWQDLRKAQDDLYDILCANRVEYKLGQMVDLFKSQTYTQNKTFTHNRVTIKFTPAQFNYDKSYIYYQLYLLPMGLQENYSEFTKPFPITPMKEVEFSTSDDTSKDTLEIKYNIYDGLEGRLTFSSIFIFISQTLIDPEANEYWPTQRGGERFQAKMIPVISKFGGENDGWWKEMIAVIDNKAQKDIRIGTFEEIMNPNIW